MDTKSPTTVRLLVDSKVVGEKLAGDPKAGLDSAFPGYGPNHGFTFSVDGITPGQHQVCLQAVNVGAGDDTVFGCRSVTMLSGPPIVFLDEVSSPRGGEITLRGWSIDPGVVSPVRVHVYVDGQLVQKVTADVKKDSLATAFPGFGANHAFNVPITGLSLADHEVCAIAIGVDGNTSNCRTVSGPSGPPLTHVDQLEGTGIGVVTLRGWSIDPDVVDPVRLHIYVDGALHSKITADAAKPSLANAFPAYGQNHAFSTTLSGISPGRHSVCIYSINHGGGSTAEQCTTVDALSGSPTLWLDEASGTTSGAVRVRGWAIDPDTTDPVRVHVYVDDVLASKITADVPKPSLGEAFPPFGAAHAFALQLDGLTAGARKVCVFAINVGDGDSSVQCRTVSVS
jgi:hypothetical protein